jgi:multidrug resistance efflux pump
LQTNETQSLHGVGHYQCFLKPTVENVRERDLLLEFLRLQIEERASGADYHTATQRAIDRAPAAATATDAHLKKARAIAEEMRQKIADKVEALRNE